MQELLLGLYACPSAPERWPAVLDQLCDRLSVISAVVQILEYREGRFHPMWTVRDSHSTAHRHEHDRVFNNDSNPRLKIGMGGPPPQAALSRDEEIFPPGSAELIEIQRRRRLLRLGANLTGVIELAPGRCLALVLHRSAVCDRPLGAEEEALTAQLLPHLRQAVELGGQFQAAVRQADLLRDASGRLGAGMALCDGAGRLIWANPSARALLNGSTALRLMAGHVRAVHPGDARPLRALLAWAAEGSLSEPHYLTLGRGEGDAAVQVMALASSPPQGIPPAEPRDVVVLLLSEPGRPLDVSPALVADLFGLSLAEARLTAGLCNGLSLGDYARQRGISEGTARIQLKRALAKTGCPRQSELVRRVCASLAVSVAGRQPAISHLGDAAVRDPSDNAPLEERREGIMSSKRARSGTLFLAATLTAGVIAASAALAYPAPPPDPSLPKSTVPPAVQDLRRKMNDADVNALTFRDMDQLFTTRTVARSGPVWALPQSQHPLDFRYSFQGQSYTAEQFLERTYTNALLVMKDGRIVSEIYRNNTTDQTRFMAWSMTKSITSILIGCAVQEGRIKSLDDRITQYLPELKGGGYDGVTIRQILQMRSGVDYEERYDFAHPGIAARNHELALVENVVRFADAARTVKRLHPPGEVWQYKTLDTAVLGWLLERVSGGSTLAAYTAQRLWEPLGAERDGFFIMDGPPGTGREFNGAGFNATLRDFARIGQMMLQDGQANGHQIVSPEWVRESTRPTGGPGPGYGYQWWVPGGQAFQAIGLQGQYIFVDPATRTVVVKLSYFPPETMEPHEETAAFLAAASAWTPR